MLTRKVLRILLWLVPFLIRKLLAHSSSIFHTIINTLKQKSSLFLGSFFFGWKTGLEPATLGTTNQCSNQLSYNHRVCFEKYNFFGSALNAQSLLERALCNMYMKCECKCNGFESFLQRLFLIFSHEFKIAY